MFHQMLSSVLLYFQYPNTPRLISHMPAVAEQVNSLSVIGGMFVPRADAVRGNAQRPLGLGVIHFRPNYSTHHQAARHSLFSSIEY